MVLLLTGGHMHLKAVGGVSLISKEAMHEFH